MYLLHKLISSMIMNVLRRDHEISVSLSANEGTDNDYYTCDMHGDDIIIASCIVHI